MTEERRVWLCEVCQRDLGQHGGSEVQPWVLLNRYGLGTGRSRGLTEVQNSDCEYLWDVGEFGEGVGDDQAVTGALVCFPGCLTTYLEAKMVAVDFEVDQRESNG